MFEVISGGMSSIFSVTSVPAGQEVFLPAGIHILFSTFNDRVSSVLVSPMT